VIPNVPIRSTRKTRWLRGSAFAGAAIVALLVASLVTGSASAAKSTTADDGVVAYTTTAVLVSSNVNGALYQPVTPDANESTAFFLTHEDSNFIGSIPCVQLAQRGYTVFCVKSQYSDAALATWDSLAQDVAKSVTYLRSLPTVKTVLLVGYSGGGAIMTYYQNVAEHGVAVCQAAARLDPCSDSLAGMPPADGVVLLDAIMGIAFDRLTEMDGSATNESNLNVRNESLDMFSAANGYNPNGSSNYSQAFVNRYTKAEGAREAKVTANAQKLQKQIARGAGQFTDDAPMPLGRDAARIWQADNNLVSHTQGKYPLISPENPNGGAPQTINSIRVPSADPTANASWSGGGYPYTANNFLSTTAIKAPNLHITDDSITGVDWDSTNTATVNNVKGVTTPLLIMAMTGHYFIVPAEMYYQSAQNTNNKTLAYVEGASHGLTPCTACATTPGEFGDTVGEIFHYVANWTAANFSN
jgi:hypothetical protein